jgi:anti-sigma regulatory factor (Ser/Thr protein kinase)
MRSGAAAGHIGYFHESAFYADDAEFLNTAMPFVLGGIAAGEPTVVTLGDHHASLIRHQTAAHPGITYLDSGCTYARPASAIRSYRRLLADLVAGGAAQIRIIGELDPSAYGATWDWWARYESTINHAYDEFPLWSICAYHSGTTPARVLDEVARTHPWTAGAGNQHVPSRRYTEPVDFLTESRAIVEDPIQRTEPAVDLIDPSPAATRHAIVARPPGVLSAEDLAGFVTGASEAVSNAIRHGHAPVRVRLWTAPDRMVLAVTDTGPGPKDPFAGLLPRAAGEPGGLGLWLAHQLCSHVAFQHGADGFTIRLTAGNPEPVEL